MHKAAYTGKLKKLKALLNLDSTNIFCANNNLENALHAATEGNNLDCCKAILEHPLAKNLLSKKTMREDETPIFYAVKSRNYEIFQLFIENGADINLKNLYGMNLLHLSALVGSKEITKYLIEKGIDLNSIDKSRNKPIDYAKRNQYDDIIKLLIGNSISENPKDQYHSETFWEGEKKQKTKMSSLHVACQKDDEKTVAKIIESGADTNSSLESQAPFFEALPPLCIACTEGKMNIVEELLKSPKTKINIQTLILKQTPLHLATQEGYLEIVKLLIEKGSNPNLTDYLGRTAAHVAKDFNQIEIYNFLKLKTDLSIRSLLGLTAHENVQNPNLIKEFPLSKITLEYQVNDINFKSLINDSEHNFRMKGVVYNNQTYHITKYNLDSTQEAFETYLEICKIMKLPFLLKIDSGRGPTPRIEGVCFAAGYLILFQNPYSILDFDQKEKHEKISILSQIAQIISLLHSQGIVHKNLSMDNFKMFVTQNTKELTICECGLTVATKNVKNLRFKAPENKDGIYSVQSDSFSFSHIMYEAYFGERIKNKNKVSLSTPDSLIDLIRLCHDDDYTNRPNFIEITDMLRQAKDEFAKTHILGNASLMIDEQEKQIFVQKMIHLQLLKTEQEKLFNENLKIGFGYRDDFKLIIYDEGNEAYIRNKWKDILGRIQKDVKEFLSRDLSDEETKCLENCKKIIFDEPKSFELFDLNSVNILTNLVQKLPEKKIFILYDLLRYLILNPHCYTLLIHKNSEILKKITSYKWKELETKQTKTMVLRFLANLFHDAEKLPYSDGSIYFQFVFNALGDSDKSIQDYALAIACNLLALPLKIALNWKLLLNKMNELVKDTKLTVEMKSKILIIIYRLIRGKSDHGKIINESKIILLSWKGINDNLLNSLINLLKIYN